LSSSSFISIYLYRSFFLLFQSWQNVIIFALQVTFGGMASKGLRAIHFSGYTEFEAGCCVSHTTEPLIGYDRLLAVVIIMLFQNICS